jgi:hypothetical protein
MEAFIFERESDLPPFKTILTAVQEIVLLWFFMKYEQIGFFSEE